MIDSAIPEKFALPPLPSVTGADPETSVLDLFRVAAAKVVSEAVSVDLDKALSGLDIGKKQGDFHIAMARFRLGGAPGPHADKVVESFKPSQYLSKCISANGFVSFTLNYPVFQYHLLRQIRSLSPSAATSAANMDGSKASVGPLDAAAKGKGYGCNTSGKGKNAVIDFSSPNIAKPFHAGHLRSTIIGAFLANLYEANGWNVVRLNYLGDWGKQFGLLALGFKKYGSEEEMENDAVKHLYNVYVQINQEAEANPAIHDEARAFFKLMEDGDEESLGLWNRFRDFSIKKLEKTYARLNIHFDIYGGESVVKPESMEEAVDILEKKGLLCEEKGGVLVDLTKYKLDKAVVRKNDGTSIYMTRDLGGAKERKDTYNFDKSIYVVAAQQDFYFKQLFKTLELMGYEWADPKAKQLQHISFGMVLGMSTRKGTVKFLDDILTDAKESMHEQMKKNEAKYAQIEDPEYTSDIIGMTAVKIQDMSARRTNDYKYDSARMTSFEGDTGPYIQYSHVRLCSIERKNPGVTLPEDVNEIDTDLLVEDKAKEILYLLGTYPAVVKDAFDVSEPSTIVTFCFKITHAVSSAWETIKVHGAEPEVAQARLYLYLCTRDVLASAMRLLTLTPLDRM